MKVKIQHPGLPDGYQISLTGLNALLLNNEEVEVDDETVAQYEATTGENFNEVVQGAVFTGIRPEPPVEEEKEPEYNGNTTEELPNEDDGVDAQ